MKKEIMNFCCSASSLQVFQRKRDLINMHDYILFMCVCVQNVYSHFDQDVSLPNVMGGGADGGRRGSVL